jgi:hypothetical protein
MISVLSAGLGRCMQAEGHGAESTPPAANRKSQGNEMTTCRWSVTSRPHTHAHCADVPRTSPPSKTCICARMPSYFHSAKNAPPRPPSCSRASGIPSQILASIGLIGMPAHASGTPSPLQSTTNQSGTGTPSPLQSTTNQSGTGTPSPLQSTTNQSGTGTPSPLQSTTNQSGTGTPSPLQSTTTLGYHSAHRHAVEDAIAGITSGPPSPTTSLPCVHAHCTPPAPRPTWPHLHVLTQRLHRVLHHRLDEQLQVGAHVEGGGGGGRSRIQPCLARLCPAFPLPPAAVDTLGCRPRGRVAAEPPLLMDEHGLAQRWDHAAPIGTDLQRVRVCM